MSAANGGFSRPAIQATCPQLSLAVNNLADTWLKPALDRLSRVDSGQERPPRPKQLNDPIWKTFEIEDREVLLLDSPLLQRLRGIKQLGLAHLVFPGANHDRFEHICGVVEAADRMFGALKQNADRRREADKREGREPPTLSESDRIVVRLAAILHDVGHGPFSHAIEPIVEERYGSELRAFNHYITRQLHLDSKIEIAELISVLIVLSPSMEKIFQHALFKRPSDCTAGELQLRVVTLIMGARRHEQLACLSAIVSGQADADKLDYMPRDAHHSGMPISFDTERLLRKVEIICCTTDNLPPAQAKNIEFAESCPNKRYFDLGIAAAGVGALEQMLIGRAFLYDRVYYHHKVRAADAMAQRLLYFVNKARAKPFDLSSLYLAVSDDTMIRLLGGEISMAKFETAGTEAAFLARSILNRDLYVRAFAFRASFHTMLPKTIDEKDRTDALADVWDPLNTDLSDLRGRLEAEQDILALAQSLATHTRDEGLMALSGKISREHIIVDLAGNRVKPVTINVHAEDGSLEEPDLFFNPARWSQVYNLQKRTGYVFCAREYVPLVALASRIYFFERWGYATSEKADRFTKTQLVIRSEWFDKLKEAGRIDNVTHEALRRTVTIRTFVRKADIQLPEQWTNEDPDIADRIAQSLRDLVPQGISTGDKRAIVDTLGGIASFVNSMHQDSRWSTKSDVNESKLQIELVQHLRARGLRVSESGAIGGGEYDVIVDQRTLTENKVAGVVDDPFTAKPTAPYQANRYATAICQRVFFTLIGYTPSEGANPVPQSQSVRVRELDGIQRNAAEVCFVVPYGMPPPSKVKKPS